jgi:Sulfotransferase family
MSAASASPPGLVYLTPPVLPPERNAAVKRTRKVHPGAFPTWAAANGFLSQITTPASGRWALLPNGKAGSTSGKRFLFELEFGHPLSVHFTDPDDINADSVAHRLNKGHVFRSLADRGEDLSFLETCVTLAIVRHPAQRAASSFRYICQTDSQAHPWFLGDRIRMNATVGFDWQKDAETIGGFEKFLEYVKMGLSDADSLPINAHWRPQHMNLHSAIVTPDMTGKVEDLSRFFRQVADRLGQAVSAAAIDAPAANPSTGTDAGNLLQSAAVKRLIHDIYKEDFDRFDYDF